MVISGEVGSFAGIPVIPVQGVPDNTAYLFSGNLAVSYENELDYYGRLARWMIRDGLSDVCGWLGEQVGTRPIRHLPPGITATTILGKVR